MYGSVNLLQEYRQEYGLKRKFLYGPMNNIKRLCQDINVQKNYGAEKLISIYGILTKKDGDINQMVTEARKIINRDAELDKFGYFEKIIDQIKWNNTVNLNKILRYEFNCDKDEFMLIDKCQYLGNNEIILELKKSSVSKNLVTLNLVRLLKYC